MYYFTEQDLHTVFPRIVSPLQYICSFRNFSIYEVNFSIYEVKNCHNEESWYMKISTFSTITIRGDMYGRSSTYYCLLLRAHTSRLHTSDVITSNTVIPHIVAAATILFWNGKTLKNSYSFHISLKTLKTLIGCFLTKVGKLFRGGKYSRKETLWGNTVCT